MSRNVVILRIDDEVAIPGAIVTTPEFDLATVDDGDSRLFTFGASESVSAAGARQTWAVANRGRGRAASRANLHGDPQRFTEVTSASRSPPLVQRGDDVERGQDFGVPFARAPHLAAQAHRDDPAAPRSRATISLDLSSTSRLTR